MNSSLRKIAAAVVFATMAVSFGTAYAEFDPKKCYDTCMERVKDREKCEYVCDYKK